MQCTKGRVEDLERSLSPIHTMTGLGDKSIVTAMTELENTKDIRSNPG